MTDLWPDLRQAARLCRRAPVMAAVIVGSLTLGIGANTAVFSFVNAIQFRPLPVADEKTLVDVSEWSATELCAGCGDRSLERLGAWAGTRVLEGILAGTSPTDPLVFTTATALLALAGLCAGVDPDSVVASSDILLVQAA